MVLVNWGGKDSQRTGKSKQATNSYFCPHMIHRTMKNLPILIFSCIALLLFACKNTPSVEGDIFGEGVAHPDKAVGFTEVMQQLDQADSVQVVLKGKVTEVCQAKGCWMNIVDPVSGSEEAMFVQFKDYGFFVPKDIAGREVLLEGKAYKEETSVEELRHYAEDAGQSEEEIAQITEPVMEKKFLASGVVLLK
jgi:hypothetical protein